MPRLLPTCAVMLALLLACDAREPAPVPSEPVSPTTPGPVAPPDPAPPEPALLAPPDPAQEPPTAEPPAPPGFDGASISSATVRITEVLRDNSWVACGIAHSTGAIVVEVLEVGEPPPKLVLVVSCPVDGGIRELLSVGKLVHVELHARAQSWPRPPVLRELPEQLPRRWVKSMTRIDVITDSG